MNEQLSKVCSKLDDISGRIEGLETRQKSLEIKIKSFALSSMSKSPAVSGKRNRVTPAALQVVQSHWSFLLYNYYFYRAGYAQYIILLMKKVNRLQLLYYVLL